MTCVAALHIFAAPSTTCHKLTIHTYFSAYFALDPAQLEINAYEILRKKDFHKKLHYLAIPWRGLWRATRDNEGMLAEKLDFLRNQLKDVCKEGGFTVVYNLNYNREAILQLLADIGIECVFTPSATLAWEKHPKVKIVAMPHYAINGVDAVPVKDIWYTFIGQAACHPIRQGLVSMRHPESAVIKERPKWFYKPGLDEYKNVLARSRFSLCPRGLNAGSIRFWESLRAEAIPVLISDDAILPDGFDWSTCTMNVKESEIGQIAEILARVSASEEERMRDACRQAYRKFSADNLVSVVENYYNRQERI